MALVLTVLGLANPSGELYAQGRSPYVLEDVIAAGYPFRDPRHQSRQRRRVAIEGVVATASWPP